MNIAYVLTADEGGIPHYVAELSNAVADQGHDVIVLKPASTTADDVFSPAVTTVDAFASSGLSMVNVLNGTLSLSRLARGFSSYRNIALIDKIAPDIVHFTDNPRFYESVFTSRAEIYDRYPVVRTYHEVFPRLFENPLSGDRSLQGILEPLVTGVNNVLNVLTAPGTEDQLIVHTETNRQSLREKGVPDERIHVIPHGAYSFFTEYGHEDIETDPNTLLFFGRIVPESGLDTLVAAIPWVRRHHPDVTLVIAGDGSISSQNKEIIRRYPSNFEVVNEFVPNEEVGYYFSRASVVVIPYRELEGHSGTATIAFAFGIPLVTTDVSEFSALVDEPGCGLVVDPEDPEGLAEAIVTVLSDNELRAQMGERSREMADRISWETVGEKHITLYESVVDRQTIPR